MDDIVTHPGMQEFWASSQLAGENAAFLEALYERYLQDPTAVPPAWRSWFDRLPRVNGERTDISHARIREAFRELVTRPRARPAPTPLVPGLAEKQVRVLQLINAYRFRGHQRARIDPLGLKQPDDLPELTLAHHGLSESDLDQPFDTGSLVGPEKATLRQIVAVLEATYCGPIGSEYMHITETTEKRWIQQRLESCAAQPSFTPQEKRRIFDRLTAAEGLERYLHTHYVGQKRFSLEGADSMIPMLDAFIQHAGAHGANEIVVGMAHRGRLNVLINVMGKKPSDLFLEFEGKAVRTGNGSGDVKYHMGFSSDFRTPGGPLHVALAFNPSHLEIVDPVVEGSVRARQERRGDRAGEQVLPLLIHGDAAFAGQGVVMETLNLSQLRGYSTKGTVHIVVNNQIGFTTSHAREARSSRYCTDVAKMVEAPIFHVNGDDPEAVVFVTQMALDYRMEFGKDVVIDLVCYRRHGHSEADEPSVTQPIMYRTIKQHPTTRVLYARRLEQEGLLDEAAVEDALEGYQQALARGERVVPDLLNGEHKHEYPFAVDWRPFLKQACTVDVDTTVSVDRIQQLWKRLERLPEGFELHPNVAKIMDNRRKMSAGALPIDWGYAETMAYASLVTEGWAVRISGQDSARGTFFHRHAVLHSVRDGELYIPLRHLAPDQARFLVINSPLSEEAVLAFEYGYATADPRTLVIWEAQFGDFANNAQVVIDQFISAGEQKWNRLCGLVLFLPHGYEGQGPEHSSARVERYLQLCAEQNMQVCIPTTPAQIFHLLRRQMLMACRKPLVVFTPKSLLRHRQAVSRMEDLAEGRFQPVIPDARAPQPERVERVVICSGKVYYHLDERRREAELDNLAIIRVEMLYPFPEALLKRVLQPYAGARHFVWCQEEPKNQGAWFQSQHHVRAALPAGAELEYAGRPFSAAPAVGYPALHVQEQRRLVDEALGLSD